MAGNMVMTQEITSAREGALLLVGICRPERKNALTGAMYLALATALREAQQDNEVRAVVIHGTENEFCAGNGQATKRLIRGDTNALSQRVREEDRHFAALLPSAEAQDAVASFLKRSNQPSKLVQTRSPQTS